MANKHEFASNVMSLAAEFQRIRETIQRYRSIYLLRGWAQGQGSPILETDVSDLGITPTQIDQFLSPFAHRLNQLMTNQALDGPVGGDDIVSILRNDV